MKLNKYITILFFFYFIFNNPLCAKKDSTLRNTTNHYIIKFAPLSLIDPTPSFQWAFENPIYQRFIMQNELGYICGHLYNVWGNVNTYSGVRFRTEIRYQLLKWNEGYNSFYLAHDFLLSTMSEHLTESFSRYNNSYTELLTYSKRKTIDATHLKIGFQTRIFKSDLIFDIYAGIGYRHINVKTTIPPDAEHHVNGWFNFERYNGNWDSPSISLGFKFGYIIK